jgi:phenylacetate-CoA ligase
MSRITGRRDDMLVIRGVNVYPSEVERVLLAEPALGPDYLLVLDERQAAPRLIACCEYQTAPVASSPRPGERPPAADLESRLREALGVRVEVRVLPAGTLPRSEVGKAVRVARWRAGSPPLPGLD